MQITEGLTFIADTAGELQKDIVRAEGEYLSTVTFLYNCNNQAKDRVGLRLQENFTKIFGKKLDHTSSRVSEELDSLMTSDAQLKEICPQVNQV